ncbi:MAG: hypothetical protein D6718_11280 [Acidobacteria bacterium]|nr:MAG: hypothetical protein D6718_11280 [Acidobacteriota bacterium]
MSRALRSAAGAAEAAVLLGLAAALRPVSPRGRVRIGAALGRLAAAADRSRRRQVETRIAGRLGLPAEDAARIARGVYRHFGRVLAEILALPEYAKERAAPLFEVTGFEHFLAAKARGRGVLVFSGHIGNWELVAARQAAAGHPLDFIARPPENPALRRAFRRWREAAGNRVLGRRGALRRAVRSLREGRSVAILIDQHVSGPPRLWLPFLGKLAAVTPALGHLALRLGAPAVPVVSVPRPDGGYDIRYFPALEPPEGGDLEERVARLTLAATQRIEGWIRERPETWLWLHDRWKPPPPNEPPSLGRRYRGVPTAGPAASRGEAP